MKKFVSLFMIVFLLSGLTGCANTTNNSTTDGNGNSNSEFSNVNSTNQEPESSKTQSSETESSKPEISETEISETEKSENVSENVLVVYFSATGNTEKAAKCIADYTDADIFEIIPVKEYTDEDLNWTNADSRVSVEHNNPDKRNTELVQLTPDNFEKYDTVFIGYPIWWAIAAWPVDNFVKENDFTGKTVIPFCTSASSDIGESGKLLEEMAKTGEWQDGKRFSENFSEDEISTWVDSLNY